MKENKIIGTLQSFRALAIIMVFIAHIEVNPIIKFWGDGGFGVSFFIVLSGFVTTITYLNKINDFSFKSYQNFIKKKITKFYPLHILMLFASMLLIVLAIIKNGENVLHNIGITFAKTLVNALLIQSFIPVNGWYMNEINGVTWFLSTTMFFYLITFAVLKCFRKMKGKRFQQLTVLSATAAIHLLIVSVLYDSPLSTYILYVCPLFRSLEFIAGMILGQIFTETSSAESKSFNFNNKKLWTVFEIIIIGIWFLNHLVRVTNHFPTIANLKSTTTFYCSMLLVFVFAYQNGLLSKLLHNKWTILIGNISFEIYIIHKVAIQYVTTLLGWNNLSAFVSAVLTFITAYLAHTMGTKLLLYIKSKNLLQKAQSSSS